MPKDLPPPYATESERNSPRRLIERPRGRQAATARRLHGEPPGRRPGASRARIRVAPNGDVFLAESGAGRIRVLRLGTDGKLAERSVFAGGLRLSLRHRLLSARPGPDARLCRRDRAGWCAFPTESGDLEAAGRAETVIGGIPTGGHATRDIAFSPDGEHALSRDRLGDAMWRRACPSFPPPKSLQASRRAMASARAGAGRRTGPDVLAYDPDGGQQAAFRHRHPQLRRAWR